MYCSQPNYSTDLEPTRQQKSVMVWFSNVQKIKNKEKREKTSPIHPPFVWSPSYIHVYVIFVGNVSRSLFSGCKLDLFKASFTHHGHPWIRVWQQVGYAKMKGTCFKGFTSWAHLVKFPSGKCHSTSLIRRACLSQSYVFLLASTRWETGLPVYSLIINLNWFRQLHETFLI